MILAAVLSIFGFILTIVILVFVHEYGHYYFAKLFNVKVEQFSIGFGKPLLTHVDKKGVKWQISSIPLGGFVKMYGDKNSISLNYKDKTKADYNLTFASKKLYARLIIIAAGPLANYFLAVIILTAFYLFCGRDETPARIERVINNSPASRVGLRVDDEIIKANGKYIKDFSELRKIINFSLGTPILLGINRGAKYREVSVTPYFKEQGQAKVPYIGIKAPSRATHKSMNIYNSAAQSIIDIIDISHLTLKAAWQMIIGKRTTAALGGPITVANQSGNYLAAGPVSYILFLASLSVNIGLINLLPIPILDGGHIVLLIYESIAKKPLKDRHQSFLTKIGGLIIIFLIVISLSNDIKNLIF